MLRIPHCLDNRLTDGLSAPLSQFWTFSIACLLFKTPLNPIGLFVPRRKHIRSLLSAQQLNAIYRFVTMVGSCLFLTIGSQTEVRFSALHASCPYSQKVLISVRASVNPRVIIQLEAMCELKTPITSPGIRPMIFRVASKVLQATMLHSAKKLLSTRVKR
jgi:hypothetical protein